MHLLVVLQTHSKGDSQHYLKMHEMKRYCGEDKPEVTRRCVASLIDTMNHAKATVPNLQIELQVFDDHSDEESVGYLKANLAKANFPVQLEHLETYGIMPSILRCYEHGRDYGQEWVYFAQDDYLYDESAIHKMLKASVEFSNNMGRAVSIYPFNDPYKYMPENVVVRSHIVRSSDRHWRTQIMTASCFMTHISVIKDEWYLFEKMGRSEVSGVMEDESINQLFRSRGYYLFVPMPSLALHMQYSTEYDPFIDWREWWDKYAKSDKVNISKDLSSVLNIGSGRSSIKDVQYADDFKDLHEYRLDLDKQSNPDIVADITDLSSVDDESFDAVYASHCVEHVDYHLVAPCIKEMLRVTKSGGKVRVIVPNLRALAKQIADGDLLGTLYMSGEGPISALDILYGHRASVADGKDMMRHKTGFTAQSMTELLSDLGINTYVVDEPGLDLVVTIHKP
jgi:SAM-dependent methyltransferase